MPLLHLTDAELAWGDLPLLDHASFSVEAGERVGLIGRNGTGKSSLMKALAGVEKLDGGALIKVEGLRVIYVEQEPGFPAAPTLRESLILRGKIDAITDEAEKLSAMAKIDEYLSRLNLKGSEPLAGASGGEKKRAALALALSQKADLLLLDEPTNHLDLDAILALETILKTEFRSSRALFVVTHDRAFLDSVVTRIMELDRGELRSYPGNFSAYEKLKAEEIRAENLERKRFDKFWAQEEVWIRRGIEARRTRNEGRVKRLEMLRKIRAERRDQLGSVRLTLDAGERSGKIVAECENLTKAFDNRVIVKDFNLRLLRGTKLGILGHNGTGKSTLIRLLLGTLTPDSGKVKLGANLSIAYYDQLRETLDETKTVADTIAPGSDWVEIKGVKKHVMSYLADFLFPPRRANIAVGALSGGERNRLLLARLFALPANLLVLDEPTNDLDIDSLELLEETLQKYTGTVILVSHDRRFLDNVVTQVLVPTDYENPNGTWRECVGGYEDWMRSYPKTKKDENEPAEKLKAPPREKPTQRVKLSFNEKRELESLPLTIETLENDYNALTEELCSPDYHKATPEKQRLDKEKLAELPQTIERAYARWDELTQKSELAQKH